MIKNSDIFKTINMSVLLILLFSMYDEFKDGNLHVDVILYIILKYIEITCTYIFL